MLVNLFLEDYPLWVSGHEIKFFVKETLMAPKFSKVVAKSKNLVANFIFRNNNNKKAIWIMYYRNSKLES